MWRRGRRRGGDGAAGPAYSPLPPAPPLTECRARAEAAGGSQVTSRPRHLLLGEVPQPLRLPALICLMGIMIIPASQGCCED